MNKCCNRALVRYQRAAGVFCDRCKEGQPRRAGGRVYVAPTPKAEPSTEPVEQAPTRTRRGDCRTSPQKGIPKPSRNTPRAYALQADPSARVLSPAERDLLSRLGTQAAIARACGLDANLVKNSFKVRLDRSQCRLLSAEIDALKSLSKSQVYAHEKQGHR